MRGTLFVTIVASLGLLPAGCVPSSDVPPVTGVPAPTPTAAPQQLVATPASLTLSLAMVVPPGGAYPGVTVTQEGASATPALVASQSTCLSGYVTVVSDVQSGTSTTVQIAPLQTGQCVLEFQGASGMQLIVPVTITP